jgi:predicted Zn-dependent protease
MLLVSTWPGWTHAAAEVSDYVLSPVPGASSAQRSDSNSKFKFMFGAPAKWPGALRWYYNHVGAPVQFNAKEVVIQQIVAESAKWTAACGIQIAYGGETDAVPKTTAGGPDGISVVGWQKPDMGISGATYVWYQSYGQNDLTLVESDMMLDPRYVTTFDQMTRTVSHEWGHAIGLGHSNVERALMSGPPDSMYTNGTDLTADDVHGCRCLYGPPAGQQAGNVCSLPEVIDFGTLAVGPTSSESQVTVTNSGNAALVMSDIRPDSGEFLVGTNGCLLGGSLAPGARCTFGVLARLTQAGDRSGEVTINTSEGPYRIPLEATGVAAQPSPTPNYEGSWWNAPAGSESGWGINFAHQGDVIFATWFTYDAAGRAWWLSMTANRTGNNVFSGTLYETRGPAFNTTPFNPNAVSYFPVGAGTLSFSDADNATFTYTVNGIAQTKAITRMMFGTLPVCTSGTQANLATATNYQDIWWAAAGTGESGWGVHFTHQGDLIFATWFTYDFDGAPLWLSATASKTSAAMYSGALFRTTGPAFGAVPFDPLKVVRTPVGTLTLTFGDGDNATFAYTVTLGKPPVSVTQTKQLTRLVFRAPGTVCQ